MSNLLESTIGIGSNSWSLLENWKLKIQDANSQMFVCKAGDSAWTSKPIVVPYYPHAKAPNNSCHVPAAGGRSYPLTLLTKVQRQSYIYI